MVDVSGATKGNNLKVFINFCGANSGIVTGSASIVTVERNGVRRNILVDYGLYQGEQEKLNFERPFLADDIDCVILTHAHLDHCGRIPALFRPYENDSIPYTGKVYCSRETMHQAVHILLNSAKLNESGQSSYKRAMEKAKEKLQKKKEKTERSFGKSSEIASIDSAVSSIEEEQEAILYDVDDVEEAFKHFVPVDVESFGNEEFSVFEGVDVKFIPTSHINGSCMVEIIAHLGEEKYTIAFTGDIGKDNTLLYKTMHYPVNRECNAIVMESLHGEAPEVETLEESCYSLKKILKKALKKQKTVIIPTFAMDRTAGLIKLLNRFMDEGLFIHCYIDSPLAMKELEVYSEFYNNSSTWFKTCDKFPFDITRFKVIDNYSQHLIASKFNGPNVFLTASGMGNGGRVLDYFEHHIQDENAIFVFPGFLTEGCPSRILHEAKKGEVVTINDNMYVKQCETIQLHGFSSHGYMGEKLKILQAYPYATTVFLNHADEKSTEGTCRDIISYNLHYEPIKRDVFIPDFGSLYRVY